MFEVNDPRYNEIYNTYYDTLHDDNDFLHYVYMKSILNIINSLRTVHNHHLEPFTKLSITMTVFSSYLCFSI